MKNKGFTLIETILGLFLLGLIAVTTLPIINSSFSVYRNQEIKLEMMYIGEMAIEKIKAYKAESSSEMYIFDTPVSDLIELFKENNSTEITLTGKENKEDFLLRIVKSQKSKSLWMISVYVYHDKEGSNINNVEYKAYLPKK